MIFRRPVSVVVTVAALLVVATTVAMADFSSNSGTWTEVTFACSGAVCAPFATRFDWSGSVYYYVFYGYVYPYEQYTGGIAYTDNPICPPLPAFGAPQRYYDGVTGQYKYIYNWSTYPSLCPVDSQCATWKSTDDFTLNYSQYTRGQFSGFIYWNGPCSPQRGLNHTVNVGF